MTISITSYKNRLIIIITLPTSYICHFVSLTSMVLSLLKNRQNSNTNERTNKRFCGKYLSTH